MISIQRELRDAGRKLEKARSDESKAMTDIRRLVHFANDAGIPKLRIAELAKISRQTVYDILNEEF